MEERRCWLRLKDTVVYSHEKWIYMRRCPPSLFVIIPILINMNGFFGNKVIREAE